VASIDLFKAAQHTVKPPMPHQQAAWNWLQEQLTPEQLKEFGAIYRAGPPANVPPLQDGALLKVPYEYQNDNESGTGYRECFSTSCAMIAKFYGKVSSDDEYNKIRAKYGDTTNAGAQVAALESLGLKARFVQNASVQTLETELKAGRPVAVGWLHNGPASKPGGGGHWTVVIGFTKTCIIHNDPNGEADMVNGGYVKLSGGKGVYYTRQNWLRRWLVEGPASGWAILVQPDVV
jgi:hypothetical protein